MKVFYSRVSSNDGSQNPERQLQQMQGFDYVFTDYCSGSIPLYDRPKGSQIKKLIDDGKLTHLEVHSIDRLARDLMTTLLVWQELTLKKITIVCRNPNLKNINDDGTIDRFSELMMSILSTMAAFEKSLIKERQLEGIRIRKNKGLYMGRRVGTSDTAERLLGKPRSKKILEYLGKGYPYHEIAKIVNVSPTTIVKVKKAAVEQGMIAAN